MFGEFSQYIPIDKMYWILFICEAQAWIEIVRLESVKLARLVAGLAEKVNGNGERSVHTLKVENMNSWDVMNAQGDSVGKVKNGVPRAECGMLEEAERRGKTLLPRNTWNWTPIE